jgi:drug/metabolite transporter (DMT)-like permease
LRSWLWAALAALAVFGAYWLVLYAYQLSRYASYALALRQLSIVIGAAASVFLFHEPARGLRFGAALTILAGAARIALAG